MKLFQTDENLLPAINRSGCYFRTMLSIAEKYIDRHLSAAEMEFIYWYLVGKGDMRKDCFLDNPGKVTEAAFFLAGKPTWRCIQIGQQYYGEDPQYWRWVVRSGNTSVTDTAIKGYTPRGNEHWIQGTAERKTLWNPHPDAPLQELRKAVLYRVNT